MPRSRSAGRGILVSRGEVEKRPERDPLVCHAWRERVAVLVVQRLNNRSNELQRRENCLGHFDVYPVKCAKWHSRLGIVI